MEIDFLDSTSVLPVAVAMFMGIFIALLYQLTNTLNEYSKSFSFTICVTSIIMAVVSMTVNNNIAVSIGLFGILSILRFRSSITNIKDMAYLLLSVAIGLTAGSNNFALSIFLGISFLTILLFFEKFWFIKKFSSEFILVISADADANLQPLFNLLDKGKNLYLIKSYITDSLKLNQELTLSIKDINESDIKNLLDDAKNIDGIKNISFITPYSTITD